MQRLFKNISLIWNRFKKSNDDFWMEIEEQFILNDIGVKTAAFIIEEVRNNCRNENINDLEQIKMLLKKYILKILKDDGAAHEASNAGAAAAILPGYNISNSIPSVWMLVGVNGVGKTSTIAKLASFFQNSGISVLLAAADTFRAAAYEQLDHFAEQLIFLLYITRGAQIRVQLCMTALRKLLQEKSTWSLSIRPAGCTLHIILWKSSKR
jgi:fused signal recognition particle receptor